MAKTRNGTANGTKAAAGDKAAAYVTSLTVENVRCFGPKQTLDLSDGKGGPARWSIILGENGTGKTTLLLTLVCHEVIDPEGHGLSAGLRSTPRLVNYWFRRLPSDQPDQLGLGRLDAGRPPRSELGCVLLDKLTSTGELHKFRQSYWELSANRIGADSPPTSLAFVAYGAGRRLARGALVEGADDDPVGTLFDEHAQLRNAEEWLLQLELASLRPSEWQKRHKVRLEQIKELLTGGLLIDVDDIRFVSAPDPRPVAHVEFHTPYGWVPLRRLGYGYQTLIAWVVDFASRMVERYPDSPNPLHEPAIVVVDEIDLHLHPAWQRKLTGFLSERFPNTQFIATAHSPLTVQAAEGANLAVLKRVGDHVEIRNDVDEIRGWRVDQIITSDLFGLPTARPPWVEVLFDRKRELLRKSKLTKAEKQELNDIRVQTDGLSVGDSAVLAKELDAMRRALDLLEQRSPHDPRSQARDAANGADHPRR